MGRILAAPRRPANSMLDCGSPAAVMSYDNEIYLTFDTDWADDEVVRDTVDLLAARQVPATMFVTHASPMLLALASNANIEVGLHPNFNNLLQSQHDETDAKTILEALHQSFPRAVSIRSHSLFQASSLHRLYASRGFRFDLNMLIPSWSGIECKPYREVDGMARLPYFWEDDVYIEAMQRGIVAGWNVDSLLAAKGLKVFDFHPIHVFLNSEHMDRYEASRPFHRDATALLRHRCPGYGSRNFLIDVIEKAKARGLAFRKVSDIQI